jgi:hypothetical protein
MLASRPTLATSAAGWEVIRAAGPNVMLYEEEEPSYELRKRWRTPVRACAEGSHNTYLNQAEGTVGVLMNDT